MAILIVIYSYVDTTIEDIKDVTNRDKASDSTIQKASAIQSRLSINYGLFRKDSKFDMDSMINRRHGKSMYKKSAIGNFCQTFRLLINSRRKPNCHTK